MASIYLLLLCIPLLLLQEPIHLFIQREPLKTITQRGPCGVAPLSLESPPRCHLLIRLLIRLLFRFLFNVLVDVVYIVGCVGTEETGVVGA